MLRSLFLSGGSAWLFVRAVTFLFVFIAASRLLPGHDRQVPGYQPHPVRMLIRYGLSVAITAALIAGCASRTVTDPPSPGITGIVTNNLTAFDAACSCHPQSAVRYLQWQQTFPENSMRAVTALNAEPLIELEPSGVSLTEITAGRYDTWLSSIARDVAGLHSPVLMSFAPEANGNWYSWGKGRSTASAEVAAWRHVVTVFRRSGAGNAQWIWIVNQLWPGSAALPPLWPGSAYVNMTGVDGYFRIPSDTFASVFGPTITELRKISNRPVLITETSARPAAGQARALAEISAGVRRDRLAGFIWFDISKPGNGPSYGAWALTGQALTDYSQIARQGGLFSVAA